MMFSLPALPRILTIAGVALVILFAFLWQAERAKSARLHGQVRELTMLREQDARDVQSASIQAQQEQRAIIAKVSAEQNKVTEGVRHEYLQELADLRRVYSLRLQGKAATNPGISGEGGTNSVPVATAGIDDANLCLSAGDLLSAQEIELARNALIEWVQRQAKAHGGE